MNEFVCSFDHHVFLSRTFSRMANAKISKEERLRRKRVSEKERRERIKSNPNRMKEENRKRRERYKRKLEAEAQLPKKQQKLSRDARRKKWRRDKQRQTTRKKEDIERILAGQIIVAPSTRSETTRTAAKRRAEKKRAYQNYVIKKMKNKIERLDRRATKYKLKHWRLKEKLSNISVSPQSVLNRKLKKFKEVVSPELKKQLLFGASVVTDIRESIKKVRSTNDKKSIGDKIDLKFVRKYKLMKYSKSVIPFRSFYKSKKIRVSHELRKRRVTRTKEYVHKYFQDDAVSALSPSKNDQIVKSGIKKQKRFLTGTLTYLYKNFCKTSPIQLSYSTFCKMKPFWVTNQSVTARDTCLCIRCENPRLMCRQLKKLEIVNSSNLDSLTEDEMGCQPIQELCRFRKCVTCCDQMVEIKEFDGDLECFYEQWISKKEVGRDGVERRRTLKEKIYCSTLNLVNQFLENVIPDYMQHRGIDWHQKQSMKELKSGLNDDSILLHIDFAENYSCKYSTEVQSIHFGGNRNQVSLHTGVRYWGEKVQSFCTVSPDLNHSPIAILIHLKPVLEEHCTEVKNLHFLSDAPATQYRNKYMFAILISEIIPLFPKLASLTWNFSESGHGKGAADGVGATLKRTADRIVSHNQDVSNFQEFSKIVVDEIKGIKITLIPSVTDEELEKKIKLASLPVKGKRLGSNLNFGNFKCLELNIIGQKF